MNRRDFAKFLGVGTAAAAADLTGAVEAAAADEPAVGVDLAVGAGAEAATDAATPGADYCVICRGPCKAGIPKSTIFKKGDLSKSLDEPSGSSGMAVLPTGFSYRTLPQPVAVERTVMVVRCDRPLTPGQRQAMHESLKSWRDDAGITLPILILDPGLSVEFKTFTDASAAPAKASV